jgi:hypothetical protein
MRHMRACYDGAAVMRQLKLSAEWSRESSIWRSREQRVIDPYSTPGYCREQLGLSSVTCQVLRQGAQDDHLRPRAELIGAHTRRPDGFAREFLQIDYADAGGIVCSVVETAGLAT